MIPRATILENYIKNSIGDKDIHIHVQKDKTGLKAFDLCYKSAQKRLTTRLPFDNFDNISDEEIEFGDLIVEEVLNLVSQVDGNNRTDLV